MRKNLYLDNRLTSSLLNYRERKNTTGTFITF